MRGVQPKQDKAVTEYSAGFNLARSPLQGDKPAQGTCVATELVRAWQSFR